MNGFINYLKGDKIIWRGTLFAFGLLSLHLLFLLIFYTSLPPYVPVYNQLPWGTERLGGKIELFLPFLITLIIIFVNIFISKIWYARLPLLSRIITITSLLIAILALIFVVRIIQLII